MDSFDRWIASRLTRFERFPRLEASLLGGRTARYLGVRLMPVIANRVLGYGLHLLEASLLARSMGGILLIRSFVVAVVCQIVVAMHWSMTEVMRSDLRRAASKKTQQHVASAWLMMSALVAVVWYVAGVAGVHWFGDDEPGAWLSELYASACIARTAVDLVVRTYYGTAYAHGRIYRPSVAIWGPQVLSFLLLLLCNQWWGALGIPIGMMVALPIGRLLVLYYTTRSLRLSRRPIAVLAWRSLRRGRFPVRTLLLAAFAGALQRVGGMSVILVALATGSSAQVLVAFYLAPLLAGASTVAQVFYPDLKRLEADRALRLFRRLVGGLLLAVTAVALLYAMLGAIAIRHLIPLGAGARFPWQFVPLLVGLAISSVIQNALLVRGRFVGLVLLGAGGAATLLWIWQPILALAAFSTSLAIGVNWMRRAVRPLSPLRDPWLALQSIDWFTIKTRRLTRAQQLEYVEKLERVAPEAAIWITGAVVNLARPPQGPSGALELIAHSAGLAGPVQHQQIAPRILAARLAAEATGSPIGSTQGALELFAQRFPDGIVIEVGRPCRGLLPGVLQAIWHDAVARRRSGSRRAQREFDVTTRLDGGAIAQIFCVPRTHPAAARADWRAYLRLSAAGTAA